MTTSFHTVTDARKKARRRMPRIMFDYIDGAAGSEIASTLNRSRIEDIRLQPRVLINTEGRQLRKTLFGRTWELPFGIAPMGMCDLTWPGADRMLAAAATGHGIPLGLSTMASSSIEQVFDHAGTHAWFQLYVGQSEAAGMKLVERAEKSGYDTIMLTVDVPIVAPRPRELRNGFRAPLRIGPKQFFDFALHPRWSIGTLRAGIPRIANNQAEDATAKFDRDESRGKVDWDFLERLRRRWPGKLVVKGVLNADDAVRSRDHGADGVYVSNHGGRQLDSAPAAIDCLAPVRAAVGREFPVLFDSGVRCGESVIKALALGASFVMLGRPFLYGMGAAGDAGLNRVIEILRTEIDVTLAQLGRTDINDIDESVLYRGVNE